MSKNVEQTNSDLTEAKKQPNDQRLLNVSERISVCIVANVENSFIDCNYSIPPPLSTLHQHAL